jgi:hypothetical protein
LEGYYLIRYSDGDTEELTEKEVMINLCAWTFVHIIWILSLRILIQ